MQALVCCTLLMVCLQSTIASGETATFDGFSEGILGTTFVDGGITFYDFDRRLADDPGLFVTEQADATLSGPGFSAPNTLGFGGWSPGPGAAFSRCGSFWFTTGSVQEFASIEMFELFGGAGNTITLEAYYDDELVATDSITTNGIFAIEHYTLTVEGEYFDELKVNGAGPSDDGCFFAVVDNVVVAPEPASATLLLVCLVVLGRRRPMRHAAPLCARQAGQALR